MPHTIRRNGVYYFKLRIPSDLVASGAFGLTKAGKPVEFIKYSLKTSVPREAKRRAALARSDAEGQIEAKRQALGAYAPAFARRANSTEEPKRDLSSLSPIERRDLVFRLFVRLERDSRDTGSRNLSTIPHEQRQDALEEAGTDLAVFSSNSPHYRPIEWADQLASLLDREGIDSSPRQGAAWIELEDEVRRAFIENAWRTVRTLGGEATPENDRLFRGLGAESALPAARRKGTSIGELCASYRESKGMKLAQASLDKFAMQFRVLEDCLGKQLEIGTVNVERAKEVADFIGRLPTNSIKRYPKLSLAEASEKEAKRARPQVIAAKTQQDLLAGISAIFRYAVEMEWIESNPFAKKLVADRIPKAERRDKPMMSPQDMTTVFSSVEFLRERSAGARGQARFWVPLLCLLHGFRTNEVCQLLVSDIEHEEGIDFCNLRETDEDGNKVKRLKTQSSRRRVPLHRELIRMGFLRFVEERRAASDVFLFPALEENRRGSKADSIGKWFGRLRRKLLADVPEVQGAKGLHSLRHSFTRATRDQKIEQGILWALGGWSDGKARNSAGEYGSGYSLATLKEAIDKIEYPGADFSALYPIAIRSRSRSSSTN